MALEKVKDVMLPLSDYAVASRDCTMLDGLRELAAAQKKLAPDKQPHRAILVADDQGNIIGKVGQLAFIKGLEPKYDEMGDISLLSQVGLSQGFITSMMDNLRLWKETFSDYVDRAKHTKLKDIMHSANEYVDEEAPITEAIHRIVMYQTLSLLVKRGDKVVGILRLSDLFTAVTNTIMKKAQGE